jgi:fucose permease
VVVALFVVEGDSLAPMLGGLFILSAAPLAIEQLRQLSPQALHAYRVHQAASVPMPYIIVGIALLLLAVAIGRFRGAMADRIGIHDAFFLPVICYLYVLFYALRGSMPNRERYANGLENA